MIAALPLLASFTLALSPSELGVVVATSGTAANQILAACPATLRVAATVPPSQLGAILSTYRNGCGDGGTVVVELPAFVGIPPPASAGPQAGANAATLYWLGTSVTAVRAAIAASGTTVDFLAGPAGFDTIPSWATDPGCAVAPCAVHTAGAFWGELAALAAQPPTPAAAGGFRLLVRVDGVPAPRPGEVRSAFCELMNAAAAASGSPLDIGWWWRGETSLLAQDATDEGFGYRRLDTECGFFFPYLVEIRATGGWPAHGTADAWLDWLAFYDRALASDSTERFGAVVFGAGEAAGPHDLSPLAPQLAAYLADPAPTPGGGSTGGVAPPPDAGGGSGDPGPGSSDGCGHAGGGLALLGLAPFALRLRRATSRA